MKNNSETAGSLAGRLETFCNITPRINKSISPHKPTHATPERHTHLKAVYLLVRRNMLLAAEAVLADEHKSSKESTHTHTDKHTHTQISTHTEAVKRQRLCSTAACQPALAGSAHTGTNVTAHEYEGDKMIRKMEEMEN